MERMVQQGLVCHASGNQRAPFVNGVYFYTLCGGGGGDTSPPVSDNFQCEWAEVKMESVHRPPPPPPPPRSLSLVDEDGDDQTTTATTTFDDICQQFDRRHRQMLHYKTCNLDMDIGNKSDRIEWAHLRYQSVFFSDASLELILQWVVCTGPLVAELVQVILFFILLLF